MADRSTGCPRCSCGSETQIHRVWPCEASKGHVDYDRSARFMNDAVLGRITEPCFWLRMIVPSSWLPELPSIPRMGGIGRWGIQCGTRSSSPTQAIPSPRCSGMLLGGGIGVHARGPQDRSGIGAGPSFLRAGVARRHFLHPSSKEAHSVERGELAAFAAVPSRVLGDLLFVTDDNKVLEGLYKRVWIVACTLLPSRANGRLVIRTFCAALLLGCPSTKGSL